MTVANYACAFILAGVVTFILAVTVYEAGWKAAAFVWGGAFAFTALVALGVHLLVS